tara:strand:+ start:2257 stop:2433 length:177 start_codon:yes stop_codon:yes gene_type:complete
MKNYTKAKKKPISKKVNKKDLLTKPKPKREPKREGISFEDAMGRALNFKNLYSGPGSK